MTNLNLEVLLLLRLKTKLKFEIVTTTAEPTTSTLRPTTKKNITTFKVLKETSTSDDYVYIEENQGELIKVSK